MRYIISGVLIHYINGIKHSTTSTLAIGGNGKEIKPYLIDWYYGKSKLNIYANINPIIMNVIGSRILSKMIESIQDDIPVTIGGATFSKRGASIIGTNEMLSTFFGKFAPKNKPIFVPYERLTYSLWQGDIKLSDRLHTALYCGMAVRATPNACLVETLWKILTSNP